MFFRRNIDLISYFEFHYIIDFGFKLILQILMSHIEFEQRTDCHDNIRILKLVPDCEIF